MQIATYVRNTSIAFVLLAIGLGVAFYAATPDARALEDLDEISAGDLIRGESLPAVYYMGADGLRYVFPNQKAYDTWYKNFDSIKFISDADLATIQIGGNVTYRPGVRMVKIDSDPKTYAVTKGGILRHVTTEAVAVALYGANWNTMIDDVPDSFFTNYTYGTPINTSSEYNVAAETAAVTTINSDKDLVAPVEISITDNGYTPIDATIDAGENVRFTNNGTVPHAATGDDLSWGSGTLQPGDSFIKKFEKTGTYPFFDNYDSSNTGAIYVE